MRSFGNALGCAPLAGRAFSCASYTPQSPAASRGGAFAVAVVSPIPSLCGERWPSISGITVFAAVHGHAIYLNQ